MAVANQSHSQPEPALGPAGQNNKGGVVDEKRKATAIIHTVITPSADAAAQKHRAPSSVSRTRKELEPIARRVAENVAVMQQLRAAIGSENGDLAREASQAVRQHAQELDPSITFDEGTTVVIILAKMLGHFRDDPAEGPND